MTHLLILAVSAGRVDVKGRGVEAADVGRSFAGRVDHVELREQGDVTQVTGVVDRSVAPAAVGRTRRRLLVLQQLLASELAAGLQLRHEPHFLRIPLRPPHRVLALAEFLLLALQPRQAGHVIGHSATTTTTTTPMMIDITYMVTSFFDKDIESWTSGR